VERLVNRLPREAREGIMRTWLEILRERHPCVSWVPVADTMTCEDESPPTETPDRGTPELATV
jgi:hypothetical protein